MTPHLNLYNITEPTAQYRALALHVANLLRDQEYERVRGIVEVLYPFDRSAYGAVMATCGPAINTVMASLPNPASASITN